MHFSTKLAKPTWEPIHQLVRNRTQTPISVPYAVWAYTENATTVTLYTSGTFSVQGALVSVYQDLIASTVRASLLKDAPRRYESHAGMDETGKGDYFGPLVAACVIGDAQDIPLWEQAGVKDSKLLSEKEIYRLEAVITKSKHSTYAVMSPSMETYNFMIGRTDENMNVYLAMLHAQALQQALQRKFVPWGVLDKFAGPEIIETFIKAPKFKLTYRTKAESDTVVAAASILARARQLRDFEALTRLAGVTLPRGAGPEALATLKRLPKKQLSKICKLNFAPCEEAFLKR